MEGLVLLLVWSSVVSDVMDGCKATLEGGEKAVIGDWLLRQTGQGSTLDPGPSPGPGPCRLLLACCISALLLFLVCYPCRHTLLKALPHFALFVFGFLSVASGSMIL